MIDMQRDYTGGDLVKVVVSTDGFGHLHVVVGNEQVDDVTKLLRANRITCTVDPSAGETFSSVDILGDATEEQIQTLLDSVP